jgi:LysM repeat protein
VSDLAKKTHVVKKGDLLVEIAEKNGVTIAALMEHNGIKNPHILWIGQKIRIPGAAEETEE